jgi:hypothetical protein
VQLLKDLANAEVSACLDRNILKLRNDFSGPILSFHAHWATSGHSRYKIERFDTRPQRMSGYAVPLTAAGRRAGKYASAERWLYGFRV